MNDLIYILFQFIIIILLFVNLLTFKLLMNEISTHLSVISHHIIEIKKKLKQ